MILNKRMMLTVLITFSPLWESFSDVGQQNCKVSDIQSSYLLTYPLLYYCGGYMDALGRLYKQFLCIFYAKYFDSHYTAIILSKSHWKNIEDILLGSGTPAKILIYLFLIRPE